MDYGRTNGETVHVLNKLNGHKHIILVLYPIGIKRFHSLPR